MKRLKGKFGFKRYLRDGANHSLEDRSKPFYNSSEVKDFDGVENEYPMFFCYMLINSIFGGNLDDAKAYYESLKGLLREVNKEMVLPYFYAVDKEQIDFERLEPGSQSRVPSSEIEEGSTHLWTQSMWLICQLLGNYFF